MNMIRKLISALVLSPLFIIPHQVIAATDLLPNLQPKPAYDLSLIKFNSDYLLLLSALTWNSGTGPLQVEGGDINSDGTQIVNQRIFRSDGTSYTRSAGDFVYHPQHGHFHLEDYAEYILTSVDPNNPISVEGSKTSFCLLDSNKIDAHLAGAPKKAYYNTCDVQTQGISVGWGDAYTSRLQGQSININGIPTGDYFLTIKTDPLNNLLESNETDNESTVKIHIDKEALTVSVNGGTPSDPPPETGDVVIISITPQTMFAGETRNVTITGNGFTNSMSVKLANGSGPQPKVSNVQFIDEHTITASITAQKGGPSRPRAWDVIIGSSVLVGAFTVFQ